MNAMEGTAEALATTLRRLIIGYRLSQAIAVAANSASPTC